MGEKANGRFGVHEYDVFEVTELGNRCVGPICNALELKAAAPARHVCVRVGSHQSRAGGMCDAPSEYLARNQCGLIGQKQ